MNSSQKKSPNPAAAKSSTEKFTREDLKRKAVQHDESDYDDDDDGEEEEEEGGVSNKFANDGSFLEMFKRMQEQQQTSNKAPSLPSSSSNTSDSQKTREKSNTVEPKRKPKILKVGVIKKQRVDDSEQNAESGIDGQQQQPESAWSRYMKEVRMYKEKYGDDEDKNRPLVK